MLAHELIKPRGGLLLVRIEVHPPEGIHQPLHAIDELVALGVELRNVCRLLSLQLLGIDNVQRRVGRARAL